MARIVVALGGNALGNSPLEQREIVKQTAKSLVNIVEKGHQLIVVHGNGPQVGLINLAFNEGHNANEKVYEMPFAECGSMSQGYIGYHLQQAIGLQLEKRIVNKKVATLVTQTLVDQNDPAFENPTKPIGLFYSEQEANRLAKENNWTVKMDANRGYRRVIASPKPIDIIEKDILKLMIDNNVIPITAGGGGIPVIKVNDSLQGVDAVIDKDFAAAKLAQILEADSLIILTAVEKVAINYGKPDQQEIEQMTIDQANEYIAQQQFAPGSMLPKVQAAMSFAQSKAGRTSIIASLEKADDAIAGKSGTRIVI